MARGQVLVIVAILLVVILACAGIAIDIGRQVAERRHVQTAADAGALAICRELVAGATDAAAATAGRQVALANLEGSPAAAAATIAADNARLYEDGHAGDPAYLQSGIIVSGTTARIAIISTVQTTLARVVGIRELETGARARCALQGSPALPIVARRYSSPPGPGGGFVDFLATEATSGLGEVDDASALGYDVRTPASEASPGPTLQLYGPDSKSNNDPDFRGFVALDVRDFTATTSRIYYNAAEPGMSDQDLKDIEGGYILTGYPGPGFPVVSTPPTGATQVAVLVGHDTPMVVGNFEDVYEVGDRVLLAVYNGTVMEIPDFSLTPPPYVALPSTTFLPTDGPQFTVSRNDAFLSTVTLHLHGDTLAPNPLHDILPTPDNTPPLPGDMNEPTWSVDTFVPDKKGTKVTMEDISTTAIPAGIYAVWLEGHSGDPYYQTRRVPVPVHIGGAVRDFSFGNSTSVGSTGVLGGMVTMPIYVSTTSASSTRWGIGGSAVALSWESFSKCGYAPASIPAGQITFSASSVTPSSSGNGTLSTLTINTAGLAAGCYTFVVRGTGTNGDGQPVTHLWPVTFTVATTESSGKYVDVIGFAVFEVTALDANAITGRAMTGITADPQDQSLRRAQRPRLLPWN
jgi:hypothetical protein